MASSEKFKSKFLKKVYPDAFVGQEIPLLNTGVVIGKCLVTGVFDELSFKNTECVAFYSKREKIHLLLLNRKEPDLHNNFKAEVLESNCYNDILNTYFDGCYENIPEWKSWNITRISNVSFEIIDNVINKQYLLNI